MTVVVVPEKKSPLFDVFFRNLPYPFASALVRGIKVALAIIIPAFVAALGDGTLISNFHVLPPATASMIGLMLAPLGIALEKYLREKGLVDDVKDLATSGAVTGPPEAEGELPPPDEPVEEPDDPVLNEPLTIR